MIELRSASDSANESPSKLTFVEIAFARSRSEAVRFRNALTSAEIAADIESGGNARRGVALLVESSNLVRASEVLATVAQEQIAAGYDDDDDDYEDDDDDFSDDDDDYEDDDDDEFYDDDDDDRDDDDDDYEADDDE